MVDIETGKLMAQLRKMNAYDDTVVIVLSDNGASAEQIIRGDGEHPSAPIGSAKSFLGIGPGWATAADTPFRLHKSWVHEGGISSPMIVHWPNGIKQGATIRKDPCHFIDILPTMAELAGADLKALTPLGPEHPGKSLAPAIRNATPVARDSTYFHHLNNRALRTEDWKLVAKGSKTAPWELYDMRTDRSEINDLVAKNSEMAQQMAAKFTELDDLWTAERMGAPATAKEMMQTAASAKEVG